MKFILVFVGVFFTSLVFGQTRTDAELYAIWKAKSNPDMKRIETYYMKFNKIILL